MEMTTHVTVGGLTFEIERWLPGMPVLSSESLAVDTETTMIVHEGVSPDLVLTQVCSFKHRKVQWVWWEQSEAYMRELFEANPTTTWVFHNSPFDLRILGGVRETPEWLKAVVENRVVDTALRFMLRQMLHGKRLGAWKLEVVAKQLLKVQLDKREDIRLTFKRDMVLTDDHVVYAVVDAIVTAQLKEVMPHELPTEPIHVKGFIALSDIGFQGMLVDREEMEKKREEYTKELNEHNGTLALFGCHKGRKGIDSVKQRILHDIEERIGIKLPRTPKAKTIQMGNRTTNMVYAAMNRDHPFLIANSAADHAGKMISTYLKESLISPDNRVHPIFEPLKETGRSSCRSPNIQNVPRKGGLRGVYVAPPGKVLVATDFNQAELCSLAETCFLTQGKSVMRDLINQGIDLHVWFGEILRESTGGSKDDGIDYRSMAKPANFGLPGGLGAPTFQAFARGYGVELTIDQCEHMKELWKEVFPEMRDYLSPQEDPHFTIEKEYLDPEGIIRKKKESAYIARTVNGRVRRNATYCSACNYAFQGLVADGAKIALWYLYRRGFKVVNFVHDEAIVELWIDDNLQQNIREIEALMIAGMKTVIKHVAIRVESTMMRRWYKEAKPVHDEDNNLLIWEPNL